MSMGEKPIEREATISITHYLGNLRKDAKVRRRCWLNLKENVSISHTCQVKTSETHKKISSTNERNSQENGSISHTRALPKTGATKLARKYDDKRKKEFL